MYLKITHLILYLLVAHALLVAQPQEYDFPLADDLPSIPYLPDPFLKYDGTRVGSSEEWAQNRDYLKAILKNYMYGQLPEGPFNVTGKELSSDPAFEGQASKKIIELSCGPVTGTEIVFQYIMYIPQGEGPFPVVMRNSLMPDSIIQMGVERGYIMSWFNREELDFDITDDPFPYSIGQVQAAYPEIEFPTLMVWAWGHMRVLDWLESYDKGDHTKVITTGLSRGGKVALMAAAFDERFAIAAPSGSGFAGCAPLKFLPDELVGRKDIANWMQPAEGNTAGKREYWFSLTLKEFIGKEDKLPFDQHFLMSLMAPRGLISLDGLADTDASPWGVHQANYGTQYVYDWLGAPQNLGMFFHAVGHVQNQESYTALWDFADWYFFEKDPTTDLYQSHFPPAEGLTNWEPPTNIHKPEMAGNSPALFKVRPHASQGLEIDITTSGAYTLKVTDIKGTVVWSRKGQGRVRHHINSLAQGMYVVSLTRAGTRQSVATLIF